MDGMYAGFDVGSGRLAPGTTKEGIVGVAVGVGRGVNGCNSPIIDKGCEVIFPVGVLNI